MSEPSMKLPLTEAEQLAKIRDAIVTALATDSLKHSVVTREIADILGLPHEGPEPGAANVVGRIRETLADKGYNTLKTPEGLHPNTVTLVLQFAGALAEKLKAAQDKYGYSNGWMDPSWMDECREKLREHLEKGDPRDVAAYCAFLWHHNERTDYARCDGRSSTARCVRRKMHGGQCSMVSDGPNQTEQPNSAPSKKEIEAAACDAANKRIDESEHDDPNYPHEFRCHVRGFIDGVEWNARRTPQAERPLSDIERTALLDKCHRYLTTAAHDEKLFGPRPSRGMVAQAIDMVIAAVTR